MEPHKNNWKLGEIATLPRTERLLKRSGRTSYEWLVSSRYICIRDATESQRGILAKVLGQFAPKYITLVGGQVFSKNDKDNLIDGTRFFSYPFPSMSEVKEALGILRSKPSLLQLFEKASMPVDTRSRYWVSETKRRFLVLKKPQCYDAYTDSTATVSDNEAPYRLTLAYFYKGEVTW